MNLILLLLLKQGLIVLFTPVIYVISGFRPYKIFSLISILVKKKFFRKTPLPCPTHQIRLCGANLAFYFYFYFFNWPLQILLLKF